MPVPEFRLHPIRLLARDTASIALGGHLKSGH
jgi:hypothetical protein